MISKKRRRKSLFPIFVVSIFSVVVVIAIISNTYNNVFLYVEPLEINILMDR